MIIEGKGNIIVEKAIAAKRNNLPIYVWGCGEIGKILCTELKKNEVEIDAFCVDRNYYKNDMKCMGIDVVCYEDLAIDTLKKVIIVAFRHNNNLNSISKCDNIEYVDEDIFSLWGGEETMISYDFVSENMSEFDALYNELQDDESRKCLEAYLNAKISGAIHFLKDIWKEDQYYDEGIVDFSSISVFADCGAFDGDSYCAFRRKYESETGTSYEGKAYLFEPDSTNYKNMCKKCERYSSVEMHNIGIWNEKSTLMFNNSEDTSSGISEEGSISIEVDSLDNLIDADVDFIKMDIEGAELKALCGARKLIEKNHPILAICVYHKKDDLLKIPQYIKEISPDYKLYLRAHCNYCQELVLYAI